MTESNKNLAANLAVPPFAARCLATAADAWHASLQHPFVRGIINGDLPQEKFRFYQMQDARYLEAYAAASALVAARCSNPDDMLWFIDSARIALVTERSLHTNYGLKLGYDAAANRRSDADPITTPIRTMIAVAQRGSMVEAVAALTPAPGSISPLARRCWRSWAPSLRHILAEWLSMYSDPQFDSYLAELLAKLQRYKR